MLTILKNIPTHLPFLELEFKEYPYRYSSESGENLSIIFDGIINSLENQDKNNDNVYKNYIKNFDNEIVKLEYKDEIYNIYRYPLKFQFAYDSKPRFTIYEPQQLKDTLQRLQLYYFFYIDRINYNPANILTLKKENKIKNNTIILVPYIIKIFMALCYRVNFDDLKNIPYFEINKESLEPYFLLIEEIAIKKSIHYENINKIHEESFKRSLTFIMNEKRAKFIEDLDNYAKNYFKNPMIIIGNDGIGKTLTLQLYTLIKFEQYKKIYFNLKLFENVNPRDYFLVELMRAFISEDKNKHKENFKEYINCIRLFQNNNFSDINNIFKVLNKIMAYLEFKGKYIMILDQFNFEKINKIDFDNFKKNIPIDFKLILCCSLNDDKNKENLFSDYENIDFYTYMDEFKNKTTKDDNNIDNDISNNNNNSKRNTFTNHIEKNEQNEKGVNISNFYLIKKRKRDIEKNYKSGIKDKNKNNEKNIKDISVLDEENNQIKNENENNKKNEPKIFNKTDTEFKLFLLENDFLDLNIPSSPSFIINFSSEKQKIYHSNLISLENILKVQNVSNKIIECMSDFNFLPKYYNNFNIFKATKIINGENNIVNVIKSFYDKELKIIRYNISVYYTKMILNLKSDIEIFKNNKINIYQMLLKIKKCIAKTYENSINFPTLYKYSKMFPFKYINILLENGEDNIKFNEQLKDKRFKLRYSFPLFEKVIDKMIYEYKNEEKININQLSGFAYGYTLELKIRENLESFKQNIEIRKVWSLEAISDKVKDEKLKEIEKEKKYNNPSRFENLEDVEGAKELKEKFFYFKTENQDNKWFDFLFLIKNINEFSMIALQISKNRGKKDIKEKEKYYNYLKEKIKIKFENLYKIKIEKIYFWFILCSENQENKSLCSYLDIDRIKYVFYSINNKCFFKGSENEKIEDINYFLKKESLIYQKIKNYINNNNISTPSDPISISLFENLAYSDFINNNEIYFENIRKSYFYGNFGPKINDKLRINIIRNLKKYVLYNNEFEILFLFSFPFKSLSHFRKDEANNELVYLFKNKDRIYILFKNNCFEIIDNNLKKSSIPKIEVRLNEEEINYPKTEFELTLLENIYTNPLIYLYKLYYLGDELSAKE